MSEHITRHRPSTVETEELDSWWDRYARSLAGTSLSKTSREIIEADSRYIVEHGVLGAGAAADERWPVERVRRGIVMGAVQSGKTASMLGVAALSLDAGVDMVLVLAGTRLALWQQTTDRLLQQLDRLDDASTSELAKRRVLVPDPPVSDITHEERSPSQLYALGRSRARRALESGQPIIAVVMKHAQHLRAMGKVIHQSIVPAIERRGRPFHLLVLDDEADDGSILDAMIERNMDPALHDLKQIPRAIVDLWESRPHTGESMSPNLFATYVGYTATPQANFLQADHNPLAPKDFAFALRTPFDRGQLLPRSPTYREPTGLGAYYTGGEAFYSRLRNSTSCHPTTGNTEIDVAEAVRAFLVAGAVRLWRESGRLLPSEARAARFEDRTTAEAKAPRPHSMLFHPSVTVADHFAAAAAVVAVTCGIDRESSARRIDSGERGLPVAELCERVLSDEAAWIRWLDDYETSGAAVQEAFDLPRAPTLPTRSDWPAVRALLLNEVIPHTQIKIINSDPNADELPRFHAVEGDGGVWHAPPDLFTIFVSGNVMSRGLTLEGLTTTLFLRSADDPLADTQMQMQRWFGYRGPYLELCRLFLPKPQLDLFRAYHDTDEALRQTVLAGMNEVAPPSGGTYVIQGRDFTATGKLANVSNVPLCPGASPFVKLVNSGKETDPNVGVIAEVFAKHASQDLTVRGVRGRILSEPFTLTEAADLLDKLRYEHYRPTPDGWEGRRWKDLEPKVGIDAASDPEHVLPFFRPPTCPPEEATAFARGGPYAISAYLRLWRACLTRRARGLVATDDPSIPWALLDPTIKTAQQPRFYVGIRYGKAEEITTGPLADLPFRVKAMSRAVAGGELQASWGTRNPQPGPGQYLGDELFDYHLHGATPPTQTPGEATWRPVGAPGLTLFYVVEQEERPFPAVAVGVALPLGGPDQFAARLPSTRSAST